MSDIKFSDFLYYDETSPSCLRWKVPRSRGVKAGDVVGYHRKDGYWEVQVCNVRFLAHRVIVNLHNIDCAGMDVDHYDRNKDNNKIENLRVVDRRTQNHNVSKRDGTVTGVTGVNRKTTLCQGVVYEYYAARWKDMLGNEESKFFPIHELGENEAFRLACEHRAIMIEELNRQGAGYTEGHGT